MTTSILSQCAGELSGNDLQTLRDFALDAPWEWRKAFEALIERAEDVDELKEEYDVDVDSLSRLRDVAADTVKTIREEMKTFVELSRDNKATKATLTDLNRVIDDALEDLNIAMEPPKKSSVTPEIP